MPPQKVLKKADLESPGRKRSIWGKVKLSDRILLLCFRNAIRQPENKGQFVGTIVMFLEITKTDIIGVIKLQVIYTGTQQQCCPAIVTNRVSQATNKLFIKK